jgi:hypothetical protein
MDIFSYYEKKKQEFLKTRNPKLYIMLENKRNAFFNTPSEEYVSKNMIKDKSNILESYKMDMKTEIYSVFHLFFLQFLPFNIWTEYEYNKNDFIVNYGVYPIASILQDKNLNEYQKERKIRLLYEDLKLSYYDKNIRFEQISLEGWYFFVKNFQKLYSQLYTFSQMIDLCPKRQEYMSSSIYSFSYLLKWKDIKIDCPFSNFKMKFFHPLSHFENEKFYIENKIKADIYFISKDNEEIQINPQIFDDLKHDTKYWKEYFYDIPWKYIDRKDIFLNIFHHLLNTIQYLKEPIFGNEISEMMRIFDSFDGTIGDMLFLLHNLIIRMDSRIEYSKFHNILNEYKKYFILKKFLQCPDEILFPEYTLQSQENIDLFETFRKTSFEILKKTVLNAYNPITNNFVIEPRHILSSFIQQLPSFNVSFKIFPEITLHNNINFFHKNKAFFQEKQILDDYYKQYSNFNETEQYNKNIISFINHQLKNN